MEHDGDLADTGGGWRTLELDTPRLTIKTKLFGRGVNKAPSFRVLTRDLRVGRCIREGPRLCGDGLTLERWDENPAFQLVASNGHRVPKLDIQGPSKQ